MRVTTPMSFNSAFVKRSLWCPNNSLNRKRMLVVTNQNALVLLFAKEIQQIRFQSTSASQPTFDTTEPFAYYTILGINRNAKQSEVKQAYFRLAKIYHPDINQEENARENFDKITEAYTTLIDLTQRYFYDNHGTACVELKKKGSNSTIFDWVPKYSIYEEQTRADGETTEVEDWFKAQGHVGYDKKISLKQRMKNSYVELRYGFSYYDFPWEWKSFFGQMVVCVIVIFVTMQSLLYSMQNISYRKPIPIYLKWENDDIYDILWFAGVRKNRSDTDKSRKGLAFPTNSSRKAPQSEMERAGMYHMPKREKKVSQYSHTIYSNTRSRTKSKNIKRHKARMEENKIIREKSWKDENIKNKKKKMNDGFNI